MIEVRNDLIDTPEKAAEVGRALAGLVTAALAEIGAAAC